MDQKTMGSFIAALRKTSGMTQRQLAEMLAVSDKTISHWERGESAPDLSMIPVLAEIFGVTCDEILKGEKINAVNNEAANNSVSRKCEKQIKYLFEKSLRKLKMSAVISLTLIIFGFILGIALNLFLETRATYAAISYIVALLFYICAVLTVVISRFIFKTEVYETPADESLTKAYNQKANCLCVYPIFTAVVFAISSKSLTSYYRPVEYMFKALLCDFGIFGYICTVIFILIVCIMKKRGFLGVKQRTNKERAQLRRIRIVTLCLAGILVFVGVFAQTAIKNRASMPYKTVDTVFNDPDKFKEYMETPKPFPQWLSADEVEIIKQERSEDFTIVYENGDITSMTEQPVGDGATSEYKYESGDEWVKFRWLNNEVEDYDIIIEENGEFVVTTYLYNKNERNLGTIEDISFMAGYVYYPLSIIIPIIVYYLLCRKNGLIKNKPKKESPMQK